MTIRTKIIRSNYRSHSHIFSSSDTLFLGTQIDFSWSIGWFVGVAKVFTWFGNEQRLVDDAQNPHRLYPLSSDHLVMPLQMRCLMIFFYPNLNRIDAAAIEFNQFANTHRKKMSNQNRKRNEEILVKGWHCTHSLD